MTPTIETPLSLYTLIIRDAPRKMKWAGRAIIHTPTGAVKNDDHQSPGMYTETKQSHYFQDDR